MPRRSRVWDHFETLIAPVSRPAGKRRGQLSRGQLPIERNGTSLRIRFRGQPTVAPIPRDHQVIAPCVPSFSLPWFLPSRTVSDAMGRNGRQERGVQRFAAVCSHHRRRERFNSLHCALHAQLPWRGAGSLRGFGHRAAQEIVREQVR